jgi:amino acid transporter
MAGMLIVFGVDHNQAIAAVVLYQAIGFLVPLIGGAIAYLFLRREFASLDGDEADDEGAGGALEPLSPSG